MRFNLDFNIYSLIFCDSKTLCIVVIKSGAWIYNNL